MIDVPPPLDCASGPELAAELGMPEVSHEWTADGLPAIRLRAKDGSWALAIGYDSLACVVEISRGEPGDPA